MKHIEAATSEQEAQVIPVFTKLFDHLHVTSLLCIVAVPCI